VDVEEDGRPAAFGIIRHGDFKDCMVSMPANPSEQ
jgi:hypothetical protein